MTLSLAILEAEQNNAAFPSLLALCGDVNIKNIDHNCLMSAIKAKERDPGTIRWSKPIPPPPQLSHETSAILIERPTGKAGLQQLCRTAYQLHTL